MDASDALRDDLTRVAAWIEAYFEHPERFRVLPDVAPGDVAAALPADAPESGEALERILDDFERIVVPATTHWNHPRFFAYFATSAAPAAVAAEALAATLDVKAMLWRTSPAATELEEVTMRWLRGLLGLPREWRGVIYDTASVAGFTALAAAREALDLEIREAGMTGGEPPMLTRAKKVYQERKESKSKDDPEARAVYRPESPDEHHTLSMDHGADR